MARLHRHGTHSQGAADARRRSHLRSKGALNWHNKDPEQGPARLAIKNHFIAMIGEYVGTVLFMIFALGGTNVALTPTTSITGQTAAGEEDSTVSTVNTSNLLYIALSFGFSLAVNAWIFFRVSGGLFNPAVSLGMALVGALTPLRAALLTLSQILGGITGAAIIDAVTPGTLNVRTTLGGGTTVVQGLFLEMFLTSLLMLAILLLAAEKNKATFIAPIGIGLALFVAELLGVYYSGGSLNPARSFGPAVVLRTFSTYHWIYWLGPCLGATLAAGFYKLLKWLQYETVLGPEDGEPAPQAKKGSKGQTAGGLSTDVGNMMGGDEEKNIGGGGGKGTLAVSGPGLGDLHTEPEPSGGGGVSDPNVYGLVDHGASGFEDQLNRIEAMLLRFNPSLMSSDTLHQVPSSPKYQSAQTLPASPRSTKIKHEGDLLTRGDEDIRPVRVKPASTTGSHNPHEGDPRYSTATVIDAKGNSKPVFK